MNFFSPVSGAIVCASLILSASAHADTIRLRIGAGHPATTTWIGAIQDFFVPETIKRVKERTGHDLVWTEGYGGTICKLGECLEAVETALLDVADIMPAFEAAKLPANTFTFAVPFGSQDPITVQKAVSEVYASSDPLKAILKDRYNQQFLAVGVVGDYGLVTAFEWDTFNDLKGHKIAAAGSNLQWLPDGVVGVQTTVNETYTSLQTGVYEGILLPADVVVGLKLQETTKQYANMSLGAQSTPLLVINDDTLNDLPEDVQAIVREVAQEWGQVVARRTADNTAKALEVLRAAGLKYVEADEQTRKDWAAALPNVPKRNAEEMDAAGQPGDVVYQYIQALMDTGHQFPRDWLGER